MAAKPISRPESGIVGKVCVLVLCAAFVVAGWVNLYNTWSEEATASAMEQWPEVSATVVSSTLVETREDRRTTYSIEILYSYEYGGVAFRSDDWGVAPIPSRFRHSAERQLKEFEPGTAIVCYVNPDNPGQAVIQREPGPTLLAFLIAIASLVIPLVWLVTTLLARATDSSKDGNGHTRIDTIAQTVIVEKIQSWQVWLAVASGLVVLTVGIRGQWATTTVSTTVVIAAVAPFLGYQLLQRLQMRPALTVTPSIVRLGETVTVHWNLKGRFVEPRQLVLELVGREKASSGSSGDQTYQHDFSVLPAFDTTDVEAIRHGEAQLTIPGTTMHSFKSEHNEIQWLVRVRTATPGLPSVTQTIGVTVQPRGGGSGGDT